MRSFRDRQADHRPRQAPGRYPWLLGAVLAAILVSGARAQSADPWPAFQRFEAARAGTDLQAAAAAGREALQAAEAAGADARTRIDVLLSLADVAQRAGNDAEALAATEQALALRSADLGADHPDLVPLLQQVADLQLRAQRYAEATAALERALAIGRAAYGERHESVVANTGRLRAVRLAAGDTEAVARLDRQIEVLTGATRVVVAGPDGESRYKQGNQGFATVRVYYGTNRAPTGRPAPAEYYGTQRGELQRGYLDVTIPETHKQGELETQSRWSVYTLFADRATLKRRYVLLDRITPLSRDGWVQSLRASVKAAPSHDVFVFIHGFNSSFEDAARRAAQLAYDLDFDGTPMMYSWPSQASTTSYTVDEAAVNVSGRRLAQFLEDVVAQSGAERVHLVAHSMGNRALIEALQTWMANHGPGPQVAGTQAKRRAFGQVVFTAPDVDRDYFTDVIDSLAQTAERVTLYASDKDLALKTSQAVHGAPRAGMAGANIITRAGLDSIDMSSVEADMLGHNYYAADAGAIYDLFRLLWRGDPPPQRCGMSARTPATRANVWLFNVDVCRGQDLLEAGVLIKRFGDRARKRVIDRIAQITDPQQKQDWSRILVRLDTLLNTAGPELLERMHMKRIASWGIGLALGLAVQLAPAAGADDVEVRAYVNDSCVVADEPFFLPESAANADQKARAIPLLGLVVGKITELFINYLVGHASERVRTAGGRKDTYYGVSREMNLFRAELDPAPVARLNTRLGCMTIVAARRFQAEGAGCTNAYLPREIARESLALPETEWRTTRSDDSVENKLRRANICVDGQASSVYEARFEFSEDGTAYRMRDAGYRVNTLLTAPAKASRSVFYTVEIASPGRKRDEEDVISTAWVNLGTVASGAQRDAPAAGGAPWMRTPAMSAEARRAFDEETRTYHDVAGEMAAARRAIDRNHRVMEELDRRIAAATRPDLAEALRQERLKAEVQIQVLESELAANSAAYAALPRKPLEFMPVSIRVGITESRSEKASLLALATVIDATGGSMASMGGDLGSALVSRRSVDPVLQGPATPATSQSGKPGTDSATAAEAALQSAQTVYFDRLVEFKAAAKAGGEAQASERLADARLLYNRARRAAGLDAVQ